MGGADIIPGVSGGTMALIVGIYERLIDALRDVFSIVVALPRFNMTEIRIRIQKVEWGFVLPLGLGIVLAIGAGAVIIRPLLHHYPAETSALFFGLVAASLMIPWHRIDRFGVREGVIGLAAAALAFWLTGLPEQAASQPSMIRVFGSASIAICAMILPGISGAFLLKAMGLYEVTLDALRGLDVGYVLVFAAGAAVGLGLFSNVLHWLLHRHHNLTMVVLLGLMAGALRALWPWMTEDRTLLLPTDADPILIPIVLAVVGFAFVFGLTHWARSIQRPPNT